MKQESKYEIKDSRIHGKGVFAAKNLKKGERIGLAISFVLGIWPSITSYLGSWVNHCDRDKSNIVLVWEESDMYDESNCYDNSNHNCEEGIGWFFEAKKDISRGDELLLDYSETPFYIEGPQDHYT